MSKVKDRDQFRFLYLQGDKRKEVTFHNSQITLRDEVQKMIDEKRDPKLIADRIKGSRVRPSRKQS